MHYNLQMHSYKEFLEDTVNKFELPHLWNEATALQLEQIQQSQSKKKIKRNNNPFVTIDGEDAKDFDDAIFCKKIKGGFLLEVAIANPAVYIEKDSPLDREAFKRGTSVYFPNFVIPMLPELLSNELCSLNPNKPKLTIVCSMSFNKEAENTSYQFFEQEIISKQRLTYKEVNNFFSSKEIKLAKDVNASIIALKEFASRRLKLKKNRNALSINSTEIEVTLNHIQEPTKIIRRKNGFAESMIEEAMIAANICAAKFLEKHSRSLLYRIHEEPQEEKLITAQEVLQSKEFKKLPAPKLINSLAQKYFNNPLSSILILQTLPRAIYSIENKGHFGLGLEHYAHFTSPIRRYPDLILHRLILAVIRKQEPPYSPEELKNIADSSSKNEKNAEQAMRSLLQKLVCKYLEKKIGGVFKGVISGLSDFGVFVILDDYYSSGLIHISNIGHGRYIFDAKKITMRNKKSGHTLKVGMLVEVKILNVVPMEGKIDLKLIRSHGKK
jgi:ribonuclease R